MTQIEQIIAEIKRRRVKYKKLISKSFGVEQEYFKGMAVVADEMMLFINSLSAEQPSEELEEAAEEYSGKASHPLNNAFKAGANWQKEQMLKSAIDAKIVNDESSGCVVDCEQGCLVLEPHRYLIGQKLKILIIKEDEQ